MPRIRSLKPEIFCSPQIMNVSRDARLLLVGLITQADDEGRGSADPRKLRATVFPGDEDMTPLRIGELLAELGRETLVQLYSATEHCNVYALPTWRRHQRIDRPSASSYPPPPATDHEDPTKNRRSIVEDSTKTRRGSEGSDGSDRKDRKGSLLGGRSRAPPDKQLVDTELEQLREAYPKRAGDQRWTKARSAIDARLRAGDTFDAMLAGVQRYAAFCTAEGMTGTKFVKQAATFFGPERGFAEPWEIPGKCKGKRSEERRGGRAC